VVARPVWKFSFFSKSIWRRIIYFYKNGKFKYKKNNFFERSSHIPLCFKNKYVKIHKGNSSRKFLVNKYVIGKKFGEFSFSRKPFHFPLRKKKGKILRR
jgi:ribosomal protein S19